MGQGARQLVQTLDTDLFAPILHSKQAESSVINMEIFSQILEMDDDDDDREFSKSIVFNFFEQANSTLVDIDKAMCVLFFKAIYTAAWSCRTMSD